MLAEASLILLLTPRQAGVQEEALVIVALLQSRGHREQPIFCGVSCGLCATFFPVVLLERVLLVMVCMLVAGGLRYFSLVRNQVHSSCSGCLVTGLHTLPSPRLTTMKMDPFSALRHEVKKTLSVVLSLA